MDTILGILGTVAPTIIKTLIPGGPLIDLGLKVIGNALGMKTGTTEEQLIQRVKAVTPDDLLKLKEADLKFKLEMKRAGIDLEKVHAGDRSSARDMQKSIRSIAPGMIATVSFLGFFGILSVMIFHSIPDKSMQPVMLLLGVLGSIVVQVANFYFGSSHSSKQKTELLAVNGPR